MIFQQSKINFQTRVAPRGDTDDQRPATARSIQSLKHQSYDKPIFNDNYMVVDQIGEGTTSRVYLCINIHTNEKIALKIMRTDFINKEFGSGIKAVESEIQILSALKHPNINQLIGYGSSGKVLKPSGRVISNLIYMQLQLVNGGIFFDFIQALGNVGEQGGRFFMTQLVNVVGYMHQKGVCHRDLKLENILIDMKDDTLQLKLADFGFSTYKNISNLKSYKGTKTYMAPEIKNGDIYDGKQVDVFSLGVILFILVVGCFPFQEAKESDYYYKMILEGNLSKYFLKTGGQFLSNEFKNLIISMLSYDPTKRPTIDQIRKHPWMQAPFNYKKAQNTMLDKLRCTDYYYKKLSSESSSIEDLSTQYSSQQSCKPQSR